MNKNEITTLFKNFNQLNVLIVGDVMIDAYYYGKVERISPEAPVPIVSVNKKDNRLGGAANVALNVKALGANPILCSVIGNDDSAKTFTKLTKNAQLSTEGLIKSSSRITTVKTRVIGNKHQVIRIDSEIETPLNEKDINELFNKIRSFIQQQQIDVLIFQDYDKGVLVPNLINKIIQLCNDNSIATTVDPKRKNFMTYQHITLFKPNFKELKEGLNIDLMPNDFKAISAAIKKLNDSQKHDINFITLSEYGVLIKDKNQEIRIPAHFRNISDVSGAGDTVISVASLCLALNQSLEMIAEIANLAGGIVCESVGVVPIDKDLLLAEAIDNLI